MADDLEAMAEHVRSFGLCGELITRNDGYQSFCALTPNHPGKHGQLPDQDSDEDLYSLVDGLLNRVAELEKVVAEHNQMAMMLTPKATLPIVKADVGLGNVAHGWVPKPAGTDQFVTRTANEMDRRLAEVRKEQRDRFMPEFDSEGTY